MTFVFTCVQSKTEKDINSGDQTSNIFDAACVPPSYAIKSIGKVAVSVRLIVDWFSCECIYQLLTAFMKSLTIPHQIWPNYAIDLRNIFKEHLSTSYL